MIAHTTEGFGIHRRLATTVNTCFRHWMDRTLLARWWGPKDELGRAFRAEIEAWEPAVDAPWRITLHAPDGSRYRQAGIFTAVAPSRQLGFTAVWGDPESPSDPTRIEVGFQAHAEATLLTFVETGFADAAARDSHRNGWEQCLDRLAEALRQPVGDAA